MSDAIRFETPENIQVTYHPAGLGTRFIAWFLDGILVYGVLFVMVIALVCSGFVSDSLLRELDQKPRPGEPPDIPLYLIAIAWLLMSTGSFFYFFLCELLLRGQTFGKRMMGVRVVQANGFALDPGSILLRNLFRVIDHFPAAWIVPVVSDKSQRLGDFVAGTLVVSDEPEQLSDVRSVLSARNSTESKYRFSSAALKRAEPRDLEAVERLLERWDRLDEQQREEFLERMVEPLARRLQVEPPPVNDRLQFLEDFLSAEYRHQHRKLN